MDIIAWMSIILALIVGVYIFFDYYLLKKNFDLFRRVKDFVIGFFLLGWGLILFFSTVGLVINSLDLTNNAILSTCEVEKSNMVVQKRRRFKTTTYYYNSLSYDGYNTTLSLDMLYEPGTQLPIVYSKINPQNAIISDKKKNFVGYLFGRSFSENFFILFALSFTFLIYGGYRVSKLFKSEKALNNLDEEITIPEMAIHQNCQNCGLQYKNTDYNQEADTWYCSGCKQPIQKI